MFLINGPDERLISPSATYRGRLAPSPTGLLHLGHARTFWIAWQRARQAGGTLVLRDEDLDPDRARPGFATAMLEDLRWLGLHWMEGPDVGGAFGPYQQSRRRAHYQAAMRKLAERELIFPCSCSRKDLAARAPENADEEPLYPGTCRARGVSAARGELNTILESPARLAPARHSSRRVNWRFRVSPGDVVEFFDGGLGPQRFVAGKDFGDFVVWRHDDVPSYQLACVVDDAAMRITEVVRGADLLVSTARQLLLYRALELRPPDFFHCPLVTDENGVRLAKRRDSLSLRALREQGRTPRSIVAGFETHPMIVP